MDANIAVQSAVKSKHIKDVALEIRGIISGLEDIKLPSLLTPESMIKAEVVIPKELIHCVG